MDRALLTVGALSAAVAVLAGGARAHWLATRLEPMRLTMIEVAMRYQLAHATGIILVALLLAHINNPLPRLAGWGFVLGTVLFPLMLYAYALTGHKPLMRVCPAGGAVFVASWVCLAIGAMLA